MINSSRMGHLLAFFTIAIWGTTFISTKVLLTDFSPVEILFIRFLMGYGALWLLAPHCLRGTSRREELCFAGAGLCGITLYYLLENIALTYTMASNVGVIVSAEPLFITLIAWLFRQSGPPPLRFFAGFAVAMGGIAAISWGGRAVSLSPLGDGLALLAAFVWAFYALLTREIGRFPYGTVQMTRRTFAYGLLFMSPALLSESALPSPAALLSPVSLGNLLFLGLGASACCFLTWNKAVQLLGPVTTSLYIYLVPAVTVLTARLILDEPLTLWTAGGTLLTIAGLFLSEAPWKRK